MMTEIPVENRAYLKAMRHCLDMYRARADDHSEAALSLALHRAGYSAALIGKNWKFLMLERPTTS